MVKLHSYLIVNIVNYTIRVQIISCSYHVLLVTISGIRSHKQRDLALYIDIFFSHCEMSPCVHHVIP